MAKNGSSDSPPFVVPTASDEEPDAYFRGETGESVNPVDPESCTDEAGFDSRPRHVLEGLLQREATEEELVAWQTMSPSLRQRATIRINLLTRWIGGKPTRGDLTAVSAAGIMGVEPKRFYQMASAWRKAPGLVAVGAYAAAKPERAARIDPRVNAALQSHVPKIVGENKGASVEALRRALEAAVRAELPELDEPEGGMRMPSLNVVRAVITRELNRIAEIRLAGESIVFDCCPTAMRAADGTSHVVFCLIDRGTLAILGQALGSLDASVDAYARVAREALARIDDAFGRSLPWAGSTRRIDLVVGQDGKALTARLESYRSEPGAIEAGPITNDKRFGSQFRKYVGDRIGRVVLRPTWVTNLPPMQDGDEVFSDAQALERLNLEVEAYNTAKVLEREPVDAVAGPPAGLVEALRFLAG